MAAVKPRHWRTPAVRHLAWLCRARNLVSRGPVFAPAEVLPRDTPARLALLDRSPAPLLNQLASVKSRRLGHYFEALYRFLLTDLLHWPVLMHNTAVRSADGRTLGELDFVVRNMASGEVEHHEIAVKYYLGLALSSPDDGPHSRWYGPNARDRLDLKFHRMFDHQCRMTERPETLTMLRAAGIHETAAPRLFMPGNLFYPVAPRTQPDLPEWVSKDHERGQWLYFSELPAATPASWTALTKPDWLGPFQSREIPDHGVTREILTAAERNHRPVLLARMERGYDGYYREVNRHFVVPDSWPGPSVN